MSTENDLEQVRDWIYTANNDDQKLSLKMKNLQEEYQEWLDATDDVEEFDALVDMYWVALDIIGFIKDYSSANNFPLRKGFEEVAKSNWSKFKRLDNGELEVLFREDGKIMKHPDTYFPPNLKNVLDANKTSEC